VPELGVAKVPKIPKAPGRFAAKKPQTHSDEGATREAKGRRAGESNATRANQWSADGGKNRLLKTVPKHA
jgi:hypothetical protein